MQGDRLGITVIDFKYWKERFNRKDRTVIEISLATHLDEVTHLVKRQAPARSFGSQGLGVTSDGQRTHDNAVNLVDKPVIETPLNSETPASSGDLVRFCTRSPWIGLLLYQLAGWPSGWSVMIRPFKPLITYEKQIRNYADLVSKINVSIISNTELVRTLNNVFKKALEIKDSRFGGFDLSNTDTFQYLVNSRTLEGHFAKIKDKVSGNQDPHSTDEAIVGNEDIAKGAVKPNPSTGRCTCLADAAVHLKLLVKFMDDYLGDLSALRRNIVSGELNKIAFKDLWLFYQTGDFVLSSRPDRQAYRVLQVNGGRPLMIREFADLDLEYLDSRKQSGLSSLTIDLVKLEYDGQNLGPVQEKVIVHPFNGEIAIGTLEVCPLNLIGEKEQLEKHLKERGELFVRLARIAHMRYSGLSAGEPQEEVK